MKSNPPAGQNDPFIRKLTQIVLDNLQNEQFGVSELANLAGYSRSQLHRKLIRVRNQSVSRFISEIRLNEALTLLKEQDLTVAEVAYQVGFNNPSYFNTCFHEYYGYPPGELARRKGNGREPDNMQPAAEEPALPPGKSKTRYFMLAGLGLAVVLVFLIPGRSFFSKRDRVQKSILVLPFVDDSPAEGSSYIINGLMEEILNKLSVIHKLNVVSRTTSENYRDSKKTIREIAREQDVDYVLEGSAQTINNTIRIRLQLIETSSDRHLWSKPYEREVSLENIFKIQEELSNLIAEELYAVLTPQERKQIGKRPTSNLAAYNKYLWGLDYIRLYEQRPVETSWEELPKAKKLFEEAIALDSAFVGAYSQLAKIYLNKYGSWGNIHAFDTRYLDSCMTLVNKALEYDAENVQVLALQAQCYLRKGMYDEAAEIFDHLPRNKPEIREYYKAAFDYFFMKDDACNTIRNFLEYEELTPPDAMISPQIYFRVTWHFTYAGYPEVAGRYAEKILQLNNDSVAYFNLMSLVEIMSGNYDEAQRYCLQTLAKDSLNMEANYLMMVSSIWLRDFDRAYHYLKTYGGYYLNGQSATMVYYVYLVNGMEAEAEKHFQAAIKILNQEIDMKTMVGTNFYSHAFLACVYATKGDKETAIEYLSRFRKRETMHLYLVLSMKEWPMLDNIRQEDEFAMLLNDFEDKYLESHAQVGELLREKGLIE